MTRNSYLLLNLMSYTLLFLCPTISQFLNLTQKASYLLLSIAYLSVAFILVYLSHFIKFPLDKNQGIVNQPLLKIIGWGFLGCCLVIAVQFSLNFISSYLFQQSSISKNTDQLLTTVKSFPFYSFTIIIAGPLIEEFVFRRAISNYFAYYLTPFSGAFLSACLFAFLHADGHLFLYFTLGMLFYGIYRYSGSIWSAIISHCLMNTFVLVSQLLTH